VQRGFERYFSDLFGILDGQLDITLYKSAGAPRAKHRIPPLLWPLTRFLRALPGGWPLGRTEYKRDSLAFGLCMLPDLMRRRFDVIHCIDPPMAHVLERLRRYTRYHGRLLFTEGSVMSPHSYPRVDRIHHVAEQAFQDALEAGVPEQHMTLVPCGLRTDAFTPTATRARLRGEHGISESAFVVLSVAALKREHKRTDYLIEEVAALPGDVVLWLDGNPEDAHVERLAVDRLGDRCRITHVPAEEVRDLYGAADVLVHASLSESFGLSIVEAICAETPVLTHDSPHFRWLVADEECLLDMSQPGRLAGRLLALQRGGLDLGIGARRRAALARRRFDWQALAPAYLDLYLRTAEGPRA